MDAVGAAADAAGSVRNLLISISMARRGVDIYVPLRLAATLGIGLAFAAASCLVPLPCPSLASKRLKDALARARCLDAATVRSLADAICRIEKDQTCMCDLARARHLSCQRGTVSQVIAKGTLPATLELMATGRLSGAKAAKAEVAHHHARTAPLRAMLRAASNRPSGVRAGGQVSRDAADDAAKDVFAEKAAPAIRRLAEEVADALEAEPTDEGMDALRGAATEAEESFGQFRELVVGRMGGAAPHMGIGCGATRR